MCGFYIILILKGIMTKVKESMQFVQQNYKLYKKRKETENKKSDTPIYRDELCVSAYSRIAD